MTNAEERQIHGKACAASDNGITSAEAQNCKCGNGNAVAVTIDSKSGMTSTPTGRQLPDCLHMSYEL